MASGSLKTLLIIPPKYEIDFPPLGTPALSGFLKSRGKPVEQIDANHEYYQHFMSRMETDGRCPQHRAFKLYALRQLLNLAFSRKEDSDIYYADLLKNPFSEAPYNDWTDSSYHFAENLLDSDVLHRFLEDEEENTFLQFYRDSRFGERLMARGAGLLGISVIGPSMIIPSLTLAKYLKNHFSHCPKIVLGGQWSTLFHKPFIERRDFAEFIDFHIRGEGETPLLSLVEYLEGARPVEEVANLSYAERGEWKVTPLHTKENMRELPAPDFDGLPLTQYDSFLSSKIHLTYETSRECYWNRCTYCVDLPMPHEGYRIKPVETVLKEIRELKAKYHFDSLVISDPAIAPKRLKDISQGILDMGEQIPFWCFGRLEKNFTREIFETAKKAGCYVVNFGMETASQRIMDFVDKGTQLSEVSRIIRDCSESGVQVALQMMMRLPTETYEEGLETIFFLINHREWIKAATFNIYYCTPGSMIFNDPERFKIRILPDQPKFRFFNLFEMTDPSSMTYAQAENLIGLYHILLSKEKASDAVQSHFDKEGMLLDDELKSADSPQQFGKCALQLPSMLVERGFIINPQRDEYDQLTSEQTRVLSALGDNPGLTMASDFSAKSETLRELIQLGLLRNEKMKSCP